MSLAERCAYYEADAAAAWDKCEERRIENEHLRERVRLAEKTMMHMDLNGEWFQRYAAAYPIPMPEDSTDKQVHG